VEEARGDAGLKALLVLGAAGLLIAGCGGDSASKTSTTGGGKLSKSEYEQSFKSIVSKAKSAAAIQLPSGASLKQQADRIEQGLARARALADQLAALDPPDEIRHAHELYVAGIRGFATGGEAVVAALRAGDMAKAQRLIRPGSAAVSSRAIKQVAAARREFASKGYDLGEVSQFP
jgi:hypothetical protein